MRSALRRMRWGVEGVEDSGLAPVKGRTVSEGRRPCPPRVLQGEKDKGRRHSGEGMSGKSAQGAADLHRAGNSGTVAGAG